MATAAVPMLWHACSAVSSPSTTRRTAFSQAFARRSLFSSYPARMKDRSGMVTEGSSRYRNSRPVFPLSRTRKRSSPLS